MGLLKDAENVKNNLEQNAKEEVLKLQKDADENVLKLQTAAEENVLKLQKAAEDDKMTFQQKLDHLAIEAKDQEEKRKQSEQEILNVKEKFVKEKGEFERKMKEDMNKAI